MCVCVYVCVGGQFDPFVGVWTSAVKPAESGEMSVMKGGD